MISKKLLFSIGILASVPCSLYSGNDFTDIFKAGASDIQALAKGYLQPLCYGVAGGLGTNWYNTAETHKLFGFDLTIGASGLMVPVSDQTYNLSGLQRLQSVNGVTSIPTFGGKGDGAQLKLVSNQGTELTRFNTPKGVTKVIPSANLQVTLGLPFDNDLSVRYIPNIEKENGKVGLWGIGLKSNMKKWTPIFKIIPLDVAFMLGYTQANVTYAFDNTITPAELTNQPYEEENPNASYANQGMKIKAGSLMANIIVSKKLLFFTPYCGVGLTSNKFDFNFTGNFPVLGDVNTSNGKVKVKTLTDPVPLHYTAIWPGATIGFRIKVLCIIALHAQYTFQKYSTASVGFGLNIR
jgi:hypothetical protein